MTVGPWKPIVLETYSTRISDVDIRVKIDDNYYADIDVNLTLSTEDPVVASVVIKEVASGFYSESSKVRGKATVKFGMTRDTYELWWPTGYGAQPLYVVEMTITDEVFIFMN